MATEIIFNDDKVIIVEATLRRNDSITATITDNPIEDGSNVADHVIKDPEIFTFDGVISDIKRNSNDLINKDIDARDRIELAIKSGEFITVNTPKKNYENYVINSFVASEETKTGNALIFTLSIKEVKTAIAETTEIPKQNLGKGSASEIKNTQAQFSKNQNKGKINTQDPNDDQENKIQEKSILFSLFLN